jgi:hypothetical protein
MRLYASEVTTRVVEVYDSGFRGILHSVFGRVLNLTADGHLVTIAGTSIGALPNGIAVELEAGWRFDVRHLQPGMGIEGDGAVLQVVGNDLQIALSRAMIVPARKQLTVPLLARAERLNRLKQAQILALRTPSDAGLAPLWRQRYGAGLTAGEDPSSALCAVARPPIAALVRGLVAGDVAAITAASSQLSGLGCGLTPSGDDLLTGIAGSMALLGAALGVEAELTLLLSGVVAGAQDRTNEIAWTYLDLAAQGEISSRLLSYISALSTGLPTDLEEATVSLFSVGATSGAELALGAATGAWVMLCRENGRVGDDSAG